MPSIRLNKDDDEEVVEEEVEADLLSFFAKSAEEDREANIDCVCGVGVAAFKVGFDELCLMGSSCDECGVAGL